MTSDGVQPPATRGRAWYRRWWVLALAAFVVVALAAGVGVAVWLSRPDTTPFEEAVEDLAAAPVVHYRTTVGGSELDVRVTAGGDMVGTLTLLGLKFEVLSLDGKTYVKAPADLLPGGTTPAVAEVAALGERLREAGAFVPIPTDRAHWSP